MQYPLIFAKLFAIFQYVAPKSSHQQGSKPLASDLAHSQKEPALSVPMPSKFEPLLLAGPSGGTSVQDAF